MNESALSLPLGSIRLFACRSWRTYKTPQSNSQISELKFEAGTSRKERNASRSVIMSGVCVYVCVFVCVCLCVCVCVCVCACGDVKFMCLRILWFNPS